MAGEIDEIRARIDIVDLVGQRVQLKKTGKSYTGLCPFHEDKRPSFTVNPMLQRYKCWSCGEGGDIFTWVMKTQNVEFPDALQTLANQAGVTLTNRSADKSSRSDRSLNLEIMETALTFFRDQIAKSSIAREYLDGRGLNTEVVADWELGYAPDVGEALAVHLQKKGYSLSLCRTLFLTEEDTSGGYYDKFRGRLMFPIRDERGDLVAFGGRVLGDALPKYINSSDTPLYRKGRVLYGMNKVAQAKSKVKPRQIVLCEGYLDVIACHRAGVQGAVASLGTSLSEDHAKMLGRWCDEVVILYDADAAGQKAADRAIEVLKPEKIPIRIALMPNGEDPDTLLRSQGPAAVVNAVKEATLPTSFRLDQIVASHVEKGQAFWTAVVEALGQASDIPEIERHIERLVSMHAGVEDQLYVRETLRKQVLARRKSSRQNNSQATAPSFQMAVSDLLPAEATLIAALLTPGLRTISHEALVLPELFVSESGRGFSHGYVSVFGDTAPTGEPSVWIDRMEPAMQDIVQRCSTDVRFNNLSDRFVKDAIDKLRMLLEKRHLQFIKQKEDPDRLSKIEQTLKRLKGDSR
ncbi:MAG: DNA primase [Chlorobia bacterium]|nr:DNA primase [Fimbriimonadaceae bacterium]